MARVSRLARRVTLAVLAALLLAAPASGQQPVFVAIWFLGFNVTQPPFDNVMARRAVAMALDRARTAAANDNNLANSFEPPMCLGHNPAARPHPYNREQAKVLMEQSGIKLEELSELGLWHLSLLRRGNWQVELQIIVESLAAVGLKASLREFGAYSALERIATLPVVKMSYWGIRADTRVCARETFLEDMVHSRGVFNYFGYRNAEVDSLIQRAIGSSDRAAKIRLYQEAEQKILDDAVVIPIYWYTFR